MDSTLSAQDAAVQAAVLKKCEQARRQLQKIGRPDAYEPRRSSRRADVGQVGRGRRPRHPRLRPDESIFAKVSRSTLEHACLYDEPLAQPMREVAPYLIRLQPWHRDTSWLFERGWGQSWGIFLESTASGDELRRHFRRFLLVRSQNGRSLYFRYYDPRLRLRVETIRLG